MDFEALKRGFEDELQKISEVNLSGIDAETILSYPKPEPVPSAAYEKAKSILSKMRPLGEEKTAFIRPDMMPGLKKITRRKDSDPPPSATDKALSVGVHGLAGAGS